MIKREGKSLLTRDLSETGRQGGSFWAESPKGQQQLGVFIVTAFIIEVADLGAVSQGM